MEKEVKLHYLVTNSGDGCAYVYFYADKKLAKKHEDREKEGGEYWAESSLSEVKLKVIDGEICFYQHRWNDETEKMGRWLD